MWTIFPVNGSVKLFSKEGLVAEYTSKEIALKALGFGWIERNVGPHFNVFSHMTRLTPYWGNTPISQQYAYVLRDREADVLTSIDFYPKATSRRTYLGLLWVRRHASWNGYGPVPGIHRQRRSNRYRSMAFIRAHKASEIFKEEGEVKGRLSCKTKQPPNNWDDYRVSATKNRNWKRFRKNQYKTTKCFL